MCQYHKSLPAGKKNLFKAKFKDSDRLTIYTSLMCAGKSCHLISVSVYCWDRSVIREDICSFQLLVRSSCFSLLNYIVKQLPLGTIEHTVQKPRDSGEVLARFGIISGDFFYFFFFWYNIFTMPWSEHVQSRHKWGHGFHHVCRFLGNLCSITSGSGNFSKLFYNL